jgi:hypothetical protein
MAAVFISSINAKGYTTVGQRNTAAHLLRHHRLCPAVHHLRPSSTWAPASAVTIPRTSAGRNSW